MFVLLSHQQSHQFNWKLINYSIIFLKNYRIWELSQKNPYKLRFWILNINRIFFFFKSQYKNITYVIYLIYRLLLLFIFYLEDKKKMVLYQLTYRSLDMVMEMIGRIACWNGKNDATLVGLKHYVQGTIFVLGG